MCSDRRTFVAGRQYYENGRIKKIERSRVNSAETYIYAKVKGVHMYNVTVWVEDGRIAHKLCDCPAFHKYPGICKHIAAVLFSYAEKSETVPDRVSTAPVMNMIIKTYTNNENAAMLNMDDAEKMTIVPHITVGGSRDVRVDFRVGARRKYVIRDICKFVHTVDNCEYFSYGKNFGFLHTQNAFDERSKKLVEFIRTIVSENEIFNSSYNKYAYLVPLSARELTLTPAAIDALMDIYIGGQLEITEKSGDMNTFDVVDENPRMEITIGKYGESAAVVSFETPIVFCGRTRCYVCRGDRVYRCSEKYSAAMESFLKAASMSDGRPLTVSHDDMMLFCTNVLPVISEYAEVSADGISLEKYAAPEAVVRFFIDNPKSGTVSCKAECSYGEMKVNVFDEPVGKNTYRNIAMETNIKMCLMRYFKYTDDGNLEIRDDDDAVFRLVDTGFAEMRRFGEVYISEQFDRLRIAAPPKFSVGISLSGGLLSFELDSDELNFKELAKILKSYKQKKKYHRLSDGSFLKLENNALATVSEAVGALGGDIDGDENVIKVPQYRALYLDSALKGEIDVRRDVNFKALIRNIKSVEDSDFEIPGTLRNILRNFQKTGFRWLKTLDSYGLSGILADEMGLGKTLQIISLFLSAKEENDGGTALIVCPASLVYNWESEFGRFAPELSVCAVSGTAEERKEIIENCTQYDVLITSYDLLKRDMELYRDIQFRFEVIDEAQYIKNYYTQSAKAVKEIKAQSRFALTGTPIENRLSELWSIFDFLMPGFLYDYKHFREEFEVPIVRDGDHDALERMKKMIAPFILRRLKTDVLHELPEKLENVVISKMETEQEKLYYAHIKQLRDSLSRSTGQTLGRDAVKILAELTRLRQICCDPALCYENYNGGSAKLETCMNIVRETLEYGHKVLIFSQFTSMLEIFEHRLREEGIEFFTLTGATSKEKRMSLVNSFQSGNVPVFLISLKAGGTGLNLTAADIVIHYDPWWNVAAQNQATDRAHRIGQKHVVTVYKFIAKNTIEEKILNLQESKKDLAESIITESTARSAALTKEDILAILED